MGFVYRSRDEKDFSLEVDLANAAKSDGVSQLVVVGAKTSLFS